MSQPYKLIYYKTAVKLKGTLKTDDSSETGYFVDVDMKLTGEIYERTLNLSFCLEKG